jgi:hypothetical protein
MVSSALPSIMGGGRDFMGTVVSLILVTAACGGETGEAGAFSLLGSGVGILGRKIEN